MDKSIAWSWYYVCPKRWLKTAKSCQCLSPKSGFFHFCCSPTKAGFLVEELADVQDMSAFVPCFRLYRSWLVWLFALSYHGHREKYWTYVPNLDFWVMDCLCFGFSLLPTGTKVIHSLSDLFWLFMFMVWRQTYDNQPSQVAVLKWSWYFCCNFGFLR